MQGRQKLDKCICQMGTSALEESRMRQRESSHRAGAWGGLAVLHAVVGQGDVEQRPEERDV